MARVRLPSGRDEVYVLAFPGPGGKCQVASAAERTGWSRAGELVFRRGEKMIAVAVTTGQPYRPRTRACCSKATSCRPARRGGLRRGARRRGFPVVQREEHRCRHGSMSFQRVRRSRTPGAAEKSSEAIPCRTGCRLRGPHPRVPNIKPVQVLMEKRFLGVSPPTKTPEARAFGGLAARCREYCAALARGGSRGLRRAYRTTGGLGEEFTRDSEFRAREVKSGVRSGLPIQRPTRTGCFSP